MRADLSTDAFAGLLSFLDNDRNRAGEKYEDLRRTINRFFEWRSAPIPEEQTDEVLDRLARKISDGVEIKNLRAYAYEVARLVLLETYKLEDRRTASVDESSLRVPADSVSEVQAQEARLACLDSCLERLEESNRALIVDYYGSEKQDRIKHRQEVARRLGLNREALANRAQRLRDKLEKCVIRCVAKNSAI